MPRDILREIVADKREYVAKLKQKLPQEELVDQLSAIAMPRDFVQAIKRKIKRQQPAIIAEIKKASPSQGVIRENFNVEEIAKSYAQHGAACLSVLTDNKYFQGHDDYLQLAKSVGEIPVLRKDFIIDEYQIYQSRLIGADCILLIVAILSDQQLKQFAALARSLNLAVLIEVHTKEELLRVIHLDAELIGINNRNLHTFTTSLSTTLALKQFFPADKILITESGIHTAADVQLMMDNGIYGFLVGESLMRADDPGLALEELLL